MHILIIGGTSGLGLALAQQLATDNTVIVTGRHPLETKSLTFITADLSTDAELPFVLDHLVEQLPVINLVIYAAGFYQEGTLDRLSDVDIAQMDNVGLRAPAMLLARLVRQQEKLAGFIAITSTSQWIPRRLEPLYTAVKAGLGMLANSLAEDPQIDKVLHVALAGMQTAFWQGTDKDMADYLDPAWVAQEILRVFADDFRYRYVRINRKPQEVVVMEER